MTLKELAAKRKNILRQALAAKDPAEKERLRSEALAILKEMEASNEKLSTEEAYGMMAD